MPNYRRAFVAGGTWFFTVNLLDRQRTFLADHITALRDAVAKTRQSRPFEINAFVVWPDHLHAIWTLPPDDSDFSTRWRLIKTYFAKAQQKHEPQSVVRVSRGERGIWQRRFWEHMIRDDRDYETHVNYCYINPVKHGWSGASAIGHIRLSIAMFAPGSFPANGPETSNLPARSASAKRKTDWAPS